MRSTIVFCLTPMKTEILMRLCCLLLYFSSILHVSFKYVFGQFDVYVLFSLWCFVNNFQFVLCMFIYCQACVYIYVLYISPMALQSYVYVILSGLLYRPTSYVLPCVWAIWRKATWRLACLQVCYWLNTRALSWHCTCITFNFMCQLLSFWDSDIRYLRDGQHFGPDHLLWVRSSPLERGDCCWSSEANIRKMCFYSHCFSRLGVATASLE